MSERFDLVVVGGGPGGYVGAIRASQLGMNVALVERTGRLGGTCLNVGCIPTKALLQSSFLYHEALSVLGEHGVSLVEPPSLDLEAVMARKRRVVEALTDGVGRLMKRHKIRVFRAHASLSGPGLVALEPASGPPAGWIPPDGKSAEVVEEPRTIAAKRVLLATGSVPVEIPSMPFDGQVVLTSTEAMSLPQVPGRLVVVGAGAVGLELASVWRRYGSEVTVIEMMDRVAPFADKMVSKRLLKALAAQGIQFYLGSKVKKAARTDQGARLSCIDSKGVTFELDCDKVLVAVGRRPCSQGLGLDELGLARDERGRVLVDKGFATNVAGIWAVGDLVPGPMLAHKASEEAVAAVEAMAGMESDLRPDLIPAVVYTEPEAAQVGLTEEQLKVMNRSYRTGRFYFLANGRALALGQTEGFVKVLADAQTDEVLGLHILGPQASELVAQVVVAMRAGLKARDLGRLVCAHPTLSETVKEAALALHREAIHG